MKKLIVTTLLAGGCLSILYAQTTKTTPKTYKPTKTEMYRKGWIDFNKNGVKDVYEDPNAPIDARIEDLLGQMTLDEKTCQMVTLYGYQRVLKDDLPTPEWKQALWKDGIGAIDEHLNGFRQWGLPPSDNENVWPASRHAWALNEVQRFFVEETRLGIPVDFTNEGIRGVESYRATNFPTQLGIGHTWNRSLVRRIGEITGREARMLGYTNVYAPILDVGRDQRWGRYEEVYGESPYLVAELGIEMVHGLQKDHQVAATAKHFVAYSNNKGAREGMARVDPQMSPHEVEMIHVYPFRRVIQEAGLLGMMSSYNDYNGIPIQGSFYWLTTRLRGEMVFKGYVVSDSDAVEYLYTKHGTAKDMKEAVRQSVEAGLNVRCTFRSPESFVEPLRELVKEGGLSEELINDRVRDILRVKFLVGLFDAPYQTDLAGADEEVENPTNEDVALQASRESIVLLKNDKQTLPLDIDRIKTIAVCGPNADKESYALTHYGPLAVDVTTVLEGIQAKVEDKAEVLYTKGCDLVDAHWPESELIEYPLTDDEQAEIDRAVANARRADVAVVVLGGGQRTCGENKSRSSLDLPGRQQQLLDERLKNAEELAAMYAQRLETGDANALETNKINLELLNVRTEARINRTTLDNKLKELTALNGNQSLVPGRPTPDGPVPASPQNLGLVEYASIPLPADFKSVCEELLACDPALSALQNESLAAQKQLSVSRQGWLPGLELGYRRNTESGHPLNGIVVGFSFPIFQNHGKVKAARSQAQSIDFQREDAKLNASATLWQLYDEACNLQASIQEYADTFGRQQDLKLLRQALEGGQISMIEYFLEVSVVYQSQTNLLQLENQYQKTMARIYKSKL